MYIEETLHRYLDDLASAQPAPGGGSTAALCGAMGAALASMVCRITSGNDAYRDIRQEIEALLAKTEYLRERFQQLLQADIDAYGRLASTYKLPRETAEQRKYRSEMIQKQLVEAARVPLEVVECASELIKTCQSIAEIGSVSVLSDVATGAILAASSAKGASFMVRINLRYMKNDAVTSEFEARLNSALAGIDSGVDQVANRIGSRS